MYVNEKTNMLRNSVTLYLRFLVPDLTFLCWRFVIPIIHRIYANYSVKITLFQTCPNISLFMCRKYWLSGNITKTDLYNFDPLKPHFYIVKLGFTVVYIIFLISAQKHRLLYSLEPPWRGGSNEYPQSMF